MYGGETVHFGLYIMLGWMGQESGWTAETDEMLIA